MRVIARARLATPSGVFTTRSTTRDMKTLLGLLGLFAFALALRLWGFAQGYPDFYGHVDEIGVAASVWNYFRAATLLPTEFTYPAFYSYLVAAGLCALAAAVSLFRRRVKKPNPAG